MTEIMDRMLNSLVRNKGQSDKKSYLIGLERGRIWADNADYFEMREWSESELEEFDDLTLPQEEVLYYMMLRNETPIEWQQYVKGWIEGVKEIADTY